MGAADLSDVATRAQATLKQHARSFRWAQVFLRPEQRASSAIAYAFCRLVDDSVDEASSAAHAAQALGELDAMIRGDAAPSPLVAAYLELAERCAFGIEPALELLRGARSDLGLVRIESDEELLTYCFRVAGTVGLMMAGILGATGDTARDRAASLGIAMQLTNICRDVLEDAERGRVYLPRARLARLGVDPEAIVGWRASKDPGVRAQVAAVVSELLEMADEYYAKGRDGFRFLPVRARLAIAVAAELYQGIGHRLRTLHGSDALGGRVRVPPVAKALLCGVSALKWAGTLAPDFDSAVAGVSGRVVESLQITREFAALLMQRACRARDRYASPRA